MDLLELYHRFRREPPSGIGLTAGEANIRPPVRVFPQEPGEAIRQGVETPSRPAVMPIVTFYHDTNYPAEGRFVSVKVTHNPAMTYPRGRQAASLPRVNLRVPPHVAYGSLFSG